MTDPPRKYYLCWDILEKTARPFYCLGGGYRTFDNLKDDEILIAMKESDFEALVRRLEDANKTNGA